ncbi:MAG TPA: carbohydrate kinase family protein, partial [Candidatus Binatus sp.]|nr:carbohydrate kinase family protein [Candidatus Binatus sp.]
AQLGMLGPKTIPILETNPLGRLLLSEFASYLDLSHVKLDGSLSSTVSLEPANSGKPVNLMISNTGSLANFGPDRLSDKDRELIQSAEYVCLVSWNLLDKGTDLAEAVFTLAKDAGKPVTFFDPGDPTPRKADIQDLTERVLTKGLVDILSVNENELLQLASTVREEEFEEGEGSLFEAASVFSMLGSRVDLHTPKFSATFVDGQRERCPCLKIIPSKVTGAGDAWNAGDIYAQGIGLSHKERLLFANATAAAYLSKTGLDPADLNEVLTMVDRLEKEAGPATTTSKHSTDEGDLNIGTTAGSFDMIDPDSEP